MPDPNVVRRAPPIRHRNRPAGGGIAGLPELGAELLAYTVVDRRGRAWTVEFAHTRAETADLVRRPAVRAGPRWADVLGTYDRTRVSAPTPGG